MSPRQAPPVIHFDHPEEGRKIRVGACMRDAHDPSHTHYKADQFAADDLPAFVDLRPHLTEVEDQGDLGSCTANALAGAVEYLEKRIANNAERVSRLFIYWNERDLEGETNQDHGAAISDGIKALKERGVCSEEVWPYDVGSVFDEPHDEAFGDAEPHTIDEAHRVKVELHDMRHCLAEGYPFVFGLEIFKAFEDIGESGEVAAPDPRHDESCGGHAMLCVGYSDEDEVFVVRNSWGPDWGDQGYCYIPYGYLSNPKFMHDAWTLRRAHDLDFNQGAGGTELPHGEKSSFFDDSNSDDAQSDDSQADEETDDDATGDDAADTDGSADGDSEGAAEDDAGDAEIAKLDKEIAELEEEIEELEEEIKKE
jgi:hypothetical protein